MNIALIFAGGTGTRMNSKARPKQFLEYQGKAIIIHTIEHFENHEAIDAIVVVGLASWLGYLEGLIKKAGFKKVKWLVPGGATAMESQYLGLKILSQDLDNPRDTVVLIHDGVRPLISEELISANIKSVREKGSAITVSSSQETLVMVNQEDEISGVYNREEFWMARAPQSFFLNDILKYHEEARKENKSFIDSVSMMKHYGRTCHIVEGSHENIKITRPIDFYIYKAFMEVRESRNVFGL